MDEPLNNVALKAELDRMAGDHIGLEIYVVALSQALAMTGRRDIVEQALGNAETLITAASVKLSGKASPVHLRGAANVIETLRNSIFGNDGEPKHAV